MNLIGGTLGVRVHRFLLPLQIFYHSAKALIGQGIKAADKAAVMGYFLIQFSALFAHAFTAASGGSALLSVTDRSRGPRGDGGQHTPKRPVPDIKTYSHSKRPPPSQKARLRFQPTVPFVRSHLSDRNKASSCWLRRVRRPRSSGGGRHDRHHRFSQDRLSEDLRLRSTQIHRESCSAFASCRYGWRIWK